MPRPAHEILRPDSPVKPAWGVFDTGWYLHRYADARAVCAGKPAGAALEYYLRVGVRLGHSPNSVFDELYYLATNPDIAALVREGAYASGFDHYCQHGHRGVSPHWLFDDALYADLYEDMTLEILDAHGCYGRYDHYLRSGQRERRMGHFLFDGMFYRERAIEAGIAPEEIDGPGPYVHFLATLGGGGDELAPCIYFDPAWYVEHHPGAKAEILRGRYSGAIQHYLTNPAPENFDPVPQFSERFYRRRYADIAAAIEAGLYRNAYQQFVQYGCFELRQPSPDIDLAFYRDMHERVRNDLNSGAVRDAFARLRGIGLREGLAYAPPEAPPALDEAGTREAFLKKARADLAIFARQGLDFSHGGEPALSVIMVAHNRFELTMRALASLRRNFAGAIELIIVDNASSDDTRRLASYVRGARVLRNEQNLGFLRAANRALAHVTAPALLHLNNDIELGHGAVAGALRRLESAGDIGAVGAKIIRSNGLLQEAGSIIWNEGTTVGYLRDAPPLTPEANFVREVDYCSAVFLLCRSALVQQLGGFDEDFAPAYYEDADLCVRMIQAGYRVVYDPAVTLEHMEFGSAATTEASMALMRRGRRIFRAKHAAFLQNQHAPSPQNLVVARSRSQKPRVLFIEDTVPLRRLGSGFVRSNDIVHAIVAAGYEAHVFPINGAPYDYMSLYGELPETAEVLAGQDFCALPEFLAGRRGVYDLIWIARTHNLERVLPLLEQAKIRAPIILDTEAIASARDALRGGLDFPQAFAAEFACAGAAEMVLAVNEREAALLTASGFANVQVLGTARRPSPTPRGFGEREGLLFVGAMHQEDSPNLDALRWYAEAIYPALAELGETPVLHAAGHVASGVSLGDLAAHPGICWHGELDDLTPLYDQARMFIAPTRFAAGTPYKIYEAASFGLPCVATNLLATQLGWGAELLTADDPNEFARQVARLYRDEALWKTLRANALSRLEREHSPEHFAARVAEILAAV
jgi:GT2 family glycosyltransferase